MQGSSIVVSDREVTLLIPIRYYTKFVLVYASLTSSAANEVDGFAAFSRLHQGDRYRARINTVVIFILFRIGE